MKYKSLLLAAAFVLANNFSASAQTPGTALSTSKVLRNADVVRMHQNGITPGKIIATILQSECNFDIFPPVLKELRTLGVPETVLMTMKMVPYGPPAVQLGESSDAPSKPRRVLIPAGTVVKIEVGSPVSSDDVAKGSVLNFRVSRPVFVNDIMVIAGGATARARVIRSTKGRSWGRAGELRWVLEDVVAVDGTRVPINFAGHVKGKNRSAAVAAAAVATGALVFPYSAPAALIWWLKEGEDAVLDQSNKSSATVRDNTDVTGLPPAKRKVVYHDVNKLKTVASNKTQSRAFNKSFKPTPLSRR